MDHLLSREYMRSNAEQTTNNTQHVDCCRFVAANRGRGPTTVGPQALSSSRYGVRKKLKVDVDGTRYHEEVGNKNEWA